MVQTEACGRVNGYILDSLDRIKPFFDSAADDVIHMSVLNQGVRMGVIRYHAGEAVLNLIVQDCFDDHRHVMPGTAVAHQRIHAVAHFFQHIYCSGRLVAAPHAGCDIRVQPPVGIRN